MSFLIRGPEGQEAQLKDVNVFLDTYEPLGYTIQDPQPSWLETPDVKTAKAERKEAAKKADAKDKKSDDDKKDA